VQTTFPAALTDQIIYNTTIFSVMFWKTSGHQADNSRSAMTAFNMGNPARAGEKQGRAEIKDSTVTLQLLLVPSAEAPSLKGTCHQLHQPLCHVS